MLSVLIAALAASLPSRVLPTSEAVLRGLDPVELTQGSEIAGDSSRSVEHEGDLYIFSSDENKKRFESDASRFAIQWGGACGRMGPLSGQCNLDRFAVHDGLIYVFASDQCRSSFLKEPTRYVDRDEPTLDEPGMDRGRGRRLLEGVVVGLGGAERVDAVKTLRRTKLADEVDGGKTYKTRQTAMYRYPDELRHESAWDTSVWFDVETPKDGFKGPKSIESLHPAARRELRRQLGRDVLYLVRHRGADGFDVAFAGAEKVGENECDVLVVRFEGVRTRLYVDRATGRVVRTAWRGRLSSGGIGDAVADWSDFRPVSGVVLPHSRAMSFDGRTLASASGTFDVLEVDVELADALFAR
jgi:YHS domain-containing protein